MGFGTMALRFASYLRYEPARLNGKPIRVGVNLPFRFKAPGEK